MMGIWELVYIYRLPEWNVNTVYMTDKLSIFSAEITAIIFGLQWIEQVQPLKRVICSDSAAALRGLSSRQTVREDPVIEIHIMLFRLQRMGIEVQFFWILAHMGLKDSLNEQADKLAKKALKEYDNKVIKVAYGRGEARSSNYNLTINERSLSQFMLNSS